VTGEWSGDMTDIDIVGTCLCPGLEAGAASLTVTESLDLGRLGLTR
jgi:hypothetical protein